MALKDAINAVYSKVQTDVSSASPEELAYLGTALEKIGGRATVFDVMEFGDTKIAELQSLANTLIASINVGYDTHIDNFESDIQDIIDTKTSAFNNLVSDTEDGLTALISTAETNLNNIVDDITDAVTTAETDVTAAATALTDAAAIANQQAINGSFFNLYYYGTMQV